MMKERKPLDLTQGTPWKVILRFAVPMLIGAVFQQLYTAVDSIFMGRFVSNEAQAAVGACASMINLFLNFALGFSTGLGIVVAQAVGAGDRERLRRTSANALVILAAVAAAMSAAALFTLKPILNLLGTPVEIIDMAVTYSKVVLSGLVCTLAYNMTAAVLRGIGNSRVPLYFLIFASVLHIVLDYVFVVLLPWGIAGVGAATILSQGISAVLTAIYMFKRYPELRFSLKMLKPDFHIIGAVTRLGLPMGLQSDCFAIGMMVIQSVINSYGPKVVQGYTVGVRVEEIFWIAFTQICQALCTYAGQNTGAGRVDRLKRGVREGGIMLLITTLASTLAALTLGKSAFGLFLAEGNDDILSIAYGFLAVNSSFYLPMGMLMLYTSTLRGIGDIKVPIISAAVELVCKMGFAILLSHWFGYFGIWFAEPIGWVLAAIPPVIWYYRGGWIRHVQNASQLASDGSGKN